MSEQLIKALPPFKCKNFTTASLVEVSQGSEVGPGLSSLGEYGLQCQHYTDLQALPQNALSAIATNRKLTP